MTGSRSGLSKVFPEVGRFVDAVDMQTAWKECNRRVLIRSRFRLILIGVVGLSIPAGFFLSPIVGRLGIPASIAPLLAGTLLGVFFAPILNWWYRRPIQRCLREELVDRGIPICLECGYDIQGQIEPRCPECGTPFDPKLLTKP